LDPLELGSIAAIFIVFFLWGPEKIPQLARMIAQARREFDRATKEFQKASAGIVDGTSPFLAPSKPAKTAAPMAALAQSGATSGLPPPASLAPTPKTGDELLIEAAKRLGIQTQGKTREQIQQDIVAMAQRAPSASGNAPPPSKNSDPAA
jgi:sec-independent protein translocase protein TatA